MTKKAWAEAKLAQLRDDEARLLAEHIPTSNWRRVHGKIRALETIRQSRRRLERWAGSSAGMRSPRVRMA
jgi:hypothetical protein